MIELKSTVIDSLKRLQRIGCETSHAIQKIRGAAIDVSWTITRPFPVSLYGFDIGGYVDRRGTIRLIELNPESHRLVIEEAPKNALHNFRIYLVDPTDGLMMVVPGPDGTGRMPTPVGYTRQIMLDFAEDIAAGFLELINLFVGHHYKGTEERLEALTSAGESLKPVSDSLDDSDTQPEAEAVKTTLEQKTSTGGVRPA